MGSPSGFILRRCLPVDIVTPPAGKIHVFLDDSTGEMSWKDDTGAVHTFVGSPGAPGTPGAPGAMGPPGLAGQDSDNSEIGLIETTRPEREVLVIACSDESSTITVGTAKVTFRMPFAMAVSEVRASVTTAPTGSTIIIDINEAGTTILSTKLSIDASEKTSTTAATPPVISDSSLADDAEITIDFDQVGSTVSGTGVKVYILGQRT